MDRIAILISLLALLISLLGYIRKRKESGNRFIRIVVLTKAIRSGLTSLHFNYRLMHLIPGEIIDENQEKTYLENLYLVKLKIESYNRLLLLDHKISGCDLRVIFNSMIIIEDNLFELSNHTVESFGDLEEINSLINPIGKEMEIIERIIKEYD